MIAVIATVNRNCARKAPTLSNSPAVQVATLFMYGSNFVASPGIPPAETWAQVALAFSPTAGILATQSGGSGIFCVGRFAKKVLIAPTF